MNMRIQVCEGLIYYRYGYHVETSRWSSMNLKRPKKTGGTKKKQTRPSTIKIPAFDSDKEDEVPEQDKACILP